MKYLDALEIVKKKQGLIGRTVGGATIDKVMICPTNPIFFQNFEARYYETFSADFAIAPFKNEDVEVGVIIGEEYLMKHRLKIEWKPIDWVEENID